jgi:cytosine/adenosine deaminase-related metal-dependent hydrolase
MDVLSKANAVGRNTMIIHGVGLRDHDMRQLADVEASVCWCPASNFYLYEQTANVPALQEAGVNLTLGTDSSLTGGLNLLDEVRIARDVFRGQTGQDLPPRWFVEAVTTRAARALMLEGRRGRIAPGHEADLLVLPNSQQDPYATLVEADARDIALLICAGVPVYGDAGYRSLFEQFTPNYASVFVSDAQRTRPGVEKLVAGDLLGLLDRMSEATGRSIQFPFMPCTARSLD